LKDSDKGYRLLNKTMKGDIVMTEKVYGRFLSEEEAVHAVSNLELKGYKAKNITIFTNLSNPSKLEKHTDVKVESSVDQSADNDSFMDKIKKVFVNEPDRDLDIHEKLTSRGIPEDEIDKCIADVEAGYVLVVINDELRMGHTPPAKPFEEAR